MEPDAIRAQVRKIVASPLLAQSQRLSSFLTFIVEAHLKGETESLKEYSIGVEVFERGADFDSRIDNVVRIQAAKLRSRLVEYYASHGVGDLIVIHMPRGSYVPEIRPRPAAAQPIPVAVYDKSRIVVLPFVNMSSDPENEYFSDGLTEELINRLACDPELQVVARTSAFRFKGMNADVREVGAKLNVGTVLEGSVRRAGNQLRVTAQLIDVETGFHLFSKTYQREFKDVFYLQDELSEAVASEIAPRRTRSPAIQRVVPNLEAYNAYLRGMFALSTRFTDLAHCVECFKEALALEPRYAAAWAGLAQGYFLMAWFYRMPGHEVSRLAQEAARNAIDSDPDSPQAQSCRGVVLCTFEWDWKQSEEWFRKSVERQPAFGGGSLFYAFCCLMPQLRLEEAQAVIERSLAVDPYNGPMHAGAIVIFARAGLYERALRQYAHACEIVPAYPPIHASAGVANEWQGNLPEAIALYRRSVAETQKAPFPYSCLGHALARAGQTEEARTIAQDLGARPDFAPADTARVYCGLGDREETLRWLDIAVETKSLHLLMVMFDPRFDWLRTEPRFERVIEQMGLREAHAARRQVNKGEV